MFPPNEMFAAGGDHFTLVKVMPEFGMLDTDGCEWQAICPLPIGDFNTYRYCLHYREGKPMRYFAADDAREIDSRWRKFTSADEAIRFTAKFCNLNLRI